MVIVDAPYLTYRAYCAGGPEAAIQASLTVLLRLLARDPEVWLTWECRGDGLELRREIYPDYKRRRGPKPPEYREAVGRLQAALPVLGLSQAWPAQGEGDDAAWTLVQDALMHDGTEVTLWARDKDWTQMLANTRVSMILPAHAKEPERTIRAADVPELLGVPVGSVLSYLALAGDTADDIPGMPRIGARRAAELLRACPRLVALVLSGQGDQAVQEVAASDACLARHAQVVADNAPLLTTMVDLVTLTHVGLERIPGCYDAAAAEAALGDLGCAWATQRLSLVAADDWT